MNIDLKIDYKEVIKQHNKVVKALQELAQRKVIVKIKEEAQYKDGTKVEAVGFWLEYGNEKLDVHYPSRPFWRNALIKYEKIIDKRFEANVQAIIEGKISVYQCYEDLGKLLVEYIKKEIKSGNFTSLAESTLKVRDRKGTGNQPLLDSKLLYNSITFEVV